MKTLFILRHAKADPDRSGSDHARTLTKRGRRDAAVAGEWVRMLELPIDLVVTSDAARASETASLAAEQIDPASEIAVEPGIYLASLEELVRIVRGLPASAATVILVGHNSGFEELVNWSLPGTDAIDHLPTAGVVAINFTADRWSGIEAHSGNLIASNIDEID